MGQIEWSTLFAVVPNCLPLTVRFHSPMNGMEWNMRNLTSTETLASIDYRYLLLIHFFDRAYVTWFNAFVNRVSCEHFTFWIVNNRITVIPQIELVSKIFISNKLTFWWLVPVQVNHLPYKPTEVTSNLLRSILSHQFF